VVQLEIRGQTVALGSTHPLKEMSNRLVSLEDKGGRCVGLTTLHFHVRIV